jgi:hypothetical protein
MVGFGLLACAAFVLTDIIMRRFGTSLGGTEIAGYAVAPPLGACLRFLNWPRAHRLGARFRLFSKALFDFP